MKKEEIREKIQAINPIFTDELLELLKQYFAVDANGMVDELKNNSKAKESIQKVILQSVTDTKLL